MSDCGQCGGCGESLGVECLLCRGSGSRVPFALSPHPERAAAELRALASMADDSPGYDPFKPGHLANTYRDAAALLITVAESVRVVFDHARAADRRSSNRPLCCEDCGRLAVRYLRNGERRGWCDRHTYGGDHSDLVEFEPAYLGAVAVVQGLLDGGRAGDGS